MEEARYWMWAKRKPDLLDPHHHHILAPTSASAAAAAMNSSYGESWEEQAFAEDAAGALGGCVWPPRSYSCSFCRREFRSAQALGGHMNVHRRDRARLKQSPMVIPASSPTEVIHSYPRTSTTSFDAAAPPPYSNNSSRDQMMCSFSYNNPNPDFQTSHAAAFRVSSSAEVVVVDGEDKIVTSTNPCFFSSFVGKNDNENMVPSLITSPPSWSSFIAEKRDRVSDSIEKKPAAGVDQQEESRAEKLEDCVTDDLSTSLNLVVRQTNTSSDEEVASFKRRRVETTKRTSISLPELSAADRSCLPQSEVFKLISGTIVELDLELRLGNGLQR